MKTNVRTIKLWALPLLFLLFAMISCREEEPVQVSDTHVSAYDPEVVIRWMDLILEVERFTPGYLPPVAARSLGYIGLASYETAIPGMPDNNSLSEYYLELQLPASNPNIQYHYPIALNAAYATMVNKLYPDIPAAQLAEVISLQQYFNAKYAEEATPQIISASIEWGESIAEAVYTWSTSDPAGHEGYLHNTDPLYVPPAGPGRWQPTYPNFGAALLPHWGEVRTFAARPDDKCEDHLPFSTDEQSEFYVQAKETENKINLIRQGKNYEDKWIAEFWSDDCPALTFTPAGRWVAIANQALEQSSANLEKAIIVQAKLGMALCDAGIRCWGEKYRFNLLRPVDYIRNEMGHSEWNTIMCPDGAGQFFTPQFPTYPSGHGTFGAAAAEVLTSMFGHDFQMTDNCHKDRSEFIGTPRTFHNFYEMASENAYSRIPIGVHFRMDAEAALDLGFKVGRRVNALPWQ
jgi:hypothetical protein